MRDGPSGESRATESDYVRAAEEALARGDMALALEQIGAALTFAPLARERLSLLDTILARAKRPLSLLPQRGEAFFGLAAVRAYALASAGKIGPAVEVLLEVAAFRPAIPYLAWIDRWTESKSGVRGVPVDRVAAGVVCFLRGFDETSTPPPGSFVNLAAADRLVEKLREARPASAARLAVLRAMMLRRLERLDEARALLEAERIRGDTRDAQVELAAVHRALGEHDIARHLLAEAASAAPNDVAARLDLADVLLEAGDFDAARRAYDDALALDLSASQRAHSEAHRAYAAVLSAPGDASCLEALRDLATRSRIAGGLLDDLLGAGATAVAIADPIADVVRSAMARAEREGGTSPVRVRVRVSEAPARSAHLALSAALVRLGREGRLVAVLDEAEEALAPPGSRAFSSEAFDRAAALARTPLDLEAWCADDAGALSVEEAEPLLDASLDGDPSWGPVERLQRMRLGTLSLVAGGVRSADAPALTWMGGLARGTDSWLAAAAIAVLGALALRGGEPAQSATALLESLVGAGLLDTRRETLARALVRLPLATADARRRAFGMRALGTRPPRSGPRNGAA